MLRCSVEMRQRYSHKKCNLYDYVNFAYPPGDLTSDLKRMLKSTRHGSQHKDLDRRGRPNRSTTCPP